MTLYTIPPSLPFARTLAAGLLKRTAARPEDLSRMLILLPTRRACRSLREAFLDLTGGKPLLLPRMQPLGDVDEEELSLSWADNPIDIAPAMPPLRRKMLLARAILERGDVQGGWAQALGLAETLGRFLDQMIIEEKEFGSLSGLAPDEYADHWQITLKFLKILTEHWPAILAAEGCIDAAHRRRLLMDAQSQLWAAHPPQTPVIAAGSTGSIPATARLLKVVAGLPHGEVILPGYDLSLDESGWMALEPSHPQWGFRQLIKRLDVPQSTVTPWPGCETATGREALTAEIMRPASSSHFWMELANNPASRAALESGLQGLSLIECDTPREEAGVIALLLREALETPGKTAALVTPDRGLAGAVSRQLDRWNIRVDDSAGIKLSASAGGRFLILLLAACAENLRPASLLALLRQELCALPPESISALEYHMLRGPRPGAGFEGLRRLLARKSSDEKFPRQAVTELEGLLRVIEPILEPLLRVMTQREALSLNDYLEAHLGCAEKLASPDALWGGEEGEALAAIFSSLMTETASAGALSPDDYAALVQHALDSTVLRPRYGTHPRLMILGQMEARLIHADRLVLGGLNEGTWPPDPGHDPWMSRPMRRTLGLPDAERSVGLAAHDFAQALGAADVFLTRASVTNGAPAIPARWLGRLETVLEACTIPKTSIQNDAYRIYFKALDNPEDIGISKRPSPCPPLAARPQKLPVTSIETWLSDPYQIYARHVLDLKSLDPLEKQLDPAGRGSLIHDILDRFIKAHPLTLPAGAHETLLALARECITLESLDESALHFWWPRFEAMMGWFLDEERRWRQGGASPYLQEIQGNWAFTTENGTPFTLTARADRIDRMKGGSEYAIIDYKTGGDYTASQIESGKRPQLALEAMMLGEGAFKGADKGAIAAVLAFCVLKGAKPPGFKAEVSEQIDELAAQARSLLEGLVDRYADPATPYPAIPDPARAPAFNDYAHLARLKEWAAGEDSSSGEEG